jgi:MFS family permease
VLIGLIPSYQTIGPAASILIVIARMLQGFSAGGEWGGSTAFIVEWAPENQRGFYGSLQQCSVAGGLLLGSVVAASVSTVLTAQTVDAWAWRIPFLLGGLLGPVGLYMRRHIGETPAFARAAQETTPATSAAPTLAWLAARAFGFTILWSVSYYIVLAYMPTFLQKHVMIGRSEALWATTAGLFALVTTIPLAGLLSDRFGRKPLLLAACVAFMVLPYPLFNLMLVGASLGTIIAIQVALALGIALYSGPGPAAIAEIFPTKGRSTWMSTGYSLSVAIFGGFAPFVATWLIEETGSVLSPAYYVMAAAVASTVVVLRLEESADKPLR